MEWKDLKETMLGSATAGLLSRLISHPLDTCKTRIQAPPGYGHILKNTFSVLKTTIIEEGITGLYRGIGAVTIGGIPATCLYFTTYELSKNFLESKGIIGQSSFLYHFISGMAAESVCCIVFVPVDVIKERLQIQKSTNLQTTNNLPNYKGSYDAFKVTLQNEGLRGIYRGYGATLLSFGPFSAIYFTIYEGIKQQVSDVLKIDQRSPTLQLSLVCAAIAGGISAFVTSPLDMAKLRLQVQRQQQGNQNMKFSFIQTLFDIYKNEGGLKALYRGSFARVAFHVPNTAITMTLFEGSKKWWSQYV